MIKKGQKILMSKTKVTGAVFFVAIFGLFSLCPPYTMSATSPSTSALQDVETLEAMTSQAIGGDDVSSPYVITGEALVKLVRGMVNFDIEGASIIYDRRTGQLFVKNTPTNQTQVEEIINSMRSAKFKQIDIEARLVTVSCTDSKGFGLDLANLSYDTKVKGVKIGTVDRVEPTSTPTNLDFPAFIGALTDRSAISNYGSQMSFTTVGEKFSIDAFLQLLQSKTQVNTLAAPRISVFNNQRAHVKVEKRENFISAIDSKFQGTGGNSTTVWFETETVVRQAESGTILDVTPSVNSDGTITLDLHPEYLLADITPTVNLTNRAGGKEFTNVLALPEFTSQTIDTCLRIPNGGVAILGGLITDDEKKSLKKVPVFGDIPWIGKALFSQEYAVRGKSYLLIFIKAKVKEPTKKL
jgi:type II secretory pathway component GspD/PulD (secretin)